MDKEFRLTAFERDQNLSEEIFSSIYIGDLFPLLEKNNVDFIYITTKMKNEFPKTFLIAQ